MFAVVCFQVEQGIRFLGQSYAAVETGQREMTSLSFTFKTLSPSGVLVYSGEVTCNELYFIKVCFPANTVTSILPGILIV